MYQIYFKSLIEKIIATLLLVLLFPLIVFITILLFFRSKNKIFFYQKRIGKNLRNFIIIKFKTMDRGKTKKFEKFLRSSSMDEIPQLINIIKGDMSLIGPRPLPVKFKNYFYTEELKRFDVLPGLTGFAQINGRNNQTWQAKFELDLFYVKNISFYLDLKIFIKTFFIVLSQKNSDLKNINQNNFKLVSLNKIRKKNNKII